MRMQLGKFLLMRDYLIADTIEDDEPRTSGALVDRSDVTVLEIFPVLLLVWERCSRTAIRRGVACLYGLIWGRRRVRGHRRQGMRG
jgi:hypothetical protein